MTSHQKISPRHYLLCFSLNAILFRAKRTQTHSCVGSNIYDMLVTLCVGRSLLCGSRKLLCVLRAFGGHTEPYLCAWRQSLVDKRGALRGSGFLECGEGPPSQIQFFASNAISIY